MFYLDKTDKTDNFSAEGQSQSQNVFQISQKLIVDFYHCFTTSFLFKISEHLFSSPGNSCPPILFKILEHQFSYPENRGEHSPEKSIALVSFS